MYKLQEQTTKLKHNFENMLKTVVMNNGKWKMCIRTLQKKYHNLFLYIALKGRRINSLTVLMILWHTPD